MANCLVLIDIYDNLTSLPQAIEKLLESKKFDHIVAVKTIKHIDAEKCTCSELHTIIKTNAEKVFKKRKLTCFTKKFKKYLKKNKIDKLYFAGADTTLSILKSALDCVDRAMEVEVLINFCTSASDYKNHEAFKVILECALGVKSINYELV